MENDKYYTPKIEEFHVGFEYEIFEDFSYNMFDDCGSPRRPIWHKRVYNSNSKSSESMEYVGGDLNKIRVKYLDKEDIEDLEFIFKEGIYVLDTPENITERIGQYIKLTLSELNKISIESVYYDDYTKEECIYTPNTYLVRNIIIKNKSELKKLLTQLNII